MTRSEGSAQSRAQKHYRDRLQADGLARFEVIGRERDKAMLRTLAKRLTQSSPESDRLRADLSALIDPHRKPTGQILAALRRSPLVGADIDITRDRSPPRDIDL